MAKDRYAWGWDDMVFDLNIPEGKVHAMVAEGEEVEKDQYAEIAERGARFSGEHNTPMSSGNVQADMDEKDGDDMVEKFSPEGSETQETFMDRCIHGLISEGKLPEKSADQCYAIWHSGKGTTQKSQDHEAVKKASLVRLVFKWANAIGGMFVRKSR